MDPIIWAVLLLVLAVMLGVFELFIPSGGILAFLSLTALAGSVVMAFYQGPVHGIVFFMVVAIGTPCGLWLAVKLWPKTPIGRRIMLTSPDPKNVLPQGHSFKQLVGQQGMAKSKMLPSGAIEIAGQTYTACSEGMSIAPGTPIEVISVHGVEIIVRPVTVDTSAETFEVAPKPEGDDLLSKPAETLGFDEDPFE